jgi:hypothetical protein
MVTRHVGTFGRLVVALGVVFAAIGTQSAAAQQAPVGLGTAGSFAVLAGTTVTNTGPSTISGDLVVSSRSAVVGFPSRHRQQWRRPCRRRRRAPSPG